jgi:hypothetical protein
MNTAIIFMNTNNHECLGSELCLELFCDLQQRFSEAFPSFLLELGSGYDRFQDFFLAGLFLASSSS